MKNYDDMGILEMAKTLGDMGDALKPKTAAHTQTPWKLADYKYSVGIWPEDQRQAPIAKLCQDDGKELAQANAAFIVRAVNCHEEFISLLTALKRHLEINERVFDVGDAGHIKRIEQAIAKAEAV